MQTYLTFYLGQSIYGIETSAVEEVFFLPEVTPILEAPREIVGLINLRGEILPIVDIYLRFGYHPLAYSLTDSIIVIRYRTRRIGIIVNQVREVKTFPITDISKNLGYNREEEEKEISLQKGIARTEDNIVVLLNPESLTLTAKKNGDRDSENLLNININELEELKRESEQELQELRLFLPNISPEERAVLQERSLALMSQNELLDTHHFIPLAIISLGTEIFGIDLKIVREFTDVLKITPIPCCPSHIVGNINLRGEIITLIDICGLLALPWSKQSSQTKVVIVDLESLVIGMIIDEVFDVLLLDPAKISSIPTAIHSVKDEYLQGATTYREKMLGLLDLAKILTSGGLIVDEAI
ncbi:chemotaxis protein CheW [Spirulina sp. 06S082]|uniref:chemotaxis protein CheW n=1 Tax=Spirulina sp. 06S082 TaxID=3110248 RepID=UPI002B209FE2|nr:chemotaxis protein CheW [Spirulina sp. 06S082]MEA5467961.1 chemotaxis protein CheW [Spirulina sp. 06S082]